MHDLAPHGPGPRKNGSTISAASPPIARRVVVHGQVQGVFFRASTEEVASEHGVVGWVSNRDDGAVEAWLEGTADDVHAVERWMRSGGPRSATVTDVDAEDVEPAGHTGFEVT